MTENKEAVDARIRATGPQKKSPGTPKVRDKKWYAAMQHKRGRRPKAQRSFQFTYKPVSGPPKTELGAKSITAEPLETRSITSLEDLVPGARLYDRETGRLGSITERVAFTFFVQWAGDPQPTQYDVDNVALYQMFEVVVSDAASN